MTPREAAMTQATRDRLFETTVVDRNPQVHSGAVVFRGTRVPVSTLTEILKAGGTIEEFLDGFPGVERWQVETFLDLSPEAVERLTSDPRARTR
jgi:uncharacterized protein (DUF433 family)